MSQNSQKPTSLMSLSKNLKPKKLFLLQTWKTCRGTQSTNVCHWCHITYLKNGSSSRNDRNISKSTGKNRL